MMEKTYPYRISRRKPYPPLNIWPLLCGRPDRLGHFRCPGWLCNMNLDRTIGPPALQFNSRVLRRGVWRDREPQTFAPRTHRQRTAQHQFREPTQRKDMRRAGPLWGVGNTVEIEPGMKAQLAECPRCGAINRIQFDDDDINSLRKAGILPLTE